MTPVEHAAPEPEPDPSPSPGVEVGTETVTVRLSDERLTPSDVESLERWANIVYETALAEEVDAGSIDVLLVDEDEMADLNVEHMGGTGSTDVLSFPLDDGDEFSIDLPGVQLHLGDIVLCPEVAERQAPLHSGTTEHEITLLLVHGVLHILGHDHAEPDETSRMRERERVNIERYGVVHPSL